MTKNMERKKVENNQNDLLIFSLKNWKIFTIVGVLAAIGSIILSYSLPVLYQSSAIIYPTATNTVSFNIESSSKLKSMQFGEEEKAEQMLQILKSSPMRNKIIHYFDLPKVYQIDSAAKYFHYKLENAYDDHISFSRTKYGSIQISVLDKNPQLAADIANKIVEYVDTLNNKIVKERTISIYKMNKRKLHKLKQENKVLSDRLDSLSELGVINARSRGELYQAFNKASNPKERSFFKQQIMANKKYGAEYDAITTKMEYKMDNFSIFKSSYEQAKSNAFENFTSRFVVQWAAPSDKKAKPVRSIIVVVFTLSALILSFIILLFIQRLKSIKKEL